jgi:hypothetical protein
MQNKDVPSNKMKKMETREETNTLEMKKQQ